MVYIVGSSFNKEHLFFSCLWKESTTAYLFHATSVRTCSHSSLACNIYTIYCNNINDFLVYLKWLHGIIFIFHFAFVYFLSFWFTLSLAIYRVRRIWTSLFFMQKTNKQNEVATENSSLLFEARILFLLSNNNCTPKSCSKVFDNLEMFCFVCFIFHPQMFA